MFLCIKQVTGTASSFGHLLLVPCSRHIWLWSAPPLHFQILIDQLDQTENETEMSFLDLYFLFSWWEMLENSWEEACIEYRVCHWIDLVACSQEGALVVSIMSGMKTSENQRKAELEGLLQAHLIFLSYLKAELTPFSIETYLNHSSKPLHWCLRAQERKFFIGKINEKKKKKKASQNLACKPAANTSKRSP